LKSKCLFIFIICISFIITPLVPSAILAEKTAPEEEEKISLDLKNIEVIELLRILSLKTGKTIVPGKEVGGRITVFLNNVNLKDVLDIILLTQNYALEKKGNIYYIMSNNEYKARNGKDYEEKRKLKTLRLNYAKPANVFNALSQLKSEAGKIIADEASGTIIMMDMPEKIELMEKTARELDQPLQTVIYDLNYAKPADARTQLNAAITPGTGQVIVDDRSGKAIVSDLPKKMEKLKRIVKEIDEETRQVFLETEIAEITLSNDFQRGINWEKVFSTTHMAGLDLVGYYPMALTTYQKLTVGTVADNKFNVVLNFLATYGDTKIISQPRISVVNNEEASLMVGTREAYVTQTLSQAQSTTVTSEAIEFVDVGVKLKVVPTINKEGFISMKIKPEVSSVKETLTTSLGSNIPIVQTSQAETVVKVKDGTMIMIAGLIKEQNTDTITGLPWLSKIPMLGSLFSNRNKTSQRTELIIFITPHLIRGDSTLPGYEAEKIIPKDIYPENVKTKIIRESEMVNTLEMPAKKMQEAFIRAESDKIEEIKQAEKLRREEEARRLQEAKKADENRKQEELRKKEEEKKAEEARKQAEFRKEEELKNKENEEARKKLEADRKQAEAERIERLKKAQEIKKAEEAKKAEELRIKEEARKQEEARKEEIARKAEAARIEKARKAEAQNLLSAKQIEELRLAEKTQRQTELRRQERLNNQAKEEARQKLEAEKQQAEAERLEKVKKAEEAKKAEEERKAEEIKKQEAARQQEAARKIEEAKKAEEIKKAEEARKQAGIRKAEAERIEKAKKAEEAKKIEQDRKQEEIRKAETEKLAKLKQIEEVKRLDEARKAAELKKIAPVKKPVEVKAPDRIKAAEYYQKGLDAQKANNLNEAKDYLQKSISADPSFAIAYNQLGIILETAGLNNEAEQMYLKTLELDPKCRAAYSNLALLNEVKGDNAKAIEYWRKRIQLGEPNDPWTQEAIERLHNLKAK